MTVTQTRQQFLTTVSLAGTAGLVRSLPAQAAEGAHQIDALLGFHRSCRSCALGMPATSSSARRLIVLGRNISAACWPGTANTSANTRSRPSACCAPFSKRLISAQLSPHGSRSLVDAGFIGRFDHALQTLNDVPYNNWREYDPKDTVRFYALRLHELGFVKSSPQKIIAEGTDWRFLDETQTRAERVSANGIPQPRTRRIR
jgi:hypothetical protein